MIRNLCIYFLQIALLTGIASQLPLLLRLRLPTAKLLYLQLTLAACLLLPFVRSWKREVVVLSGGTTTGQTFTFAAPRETPFHIPFETIALALLAAGIFARLCRLAAGFHKLRRYRLHSEPLHPRCLWATEADLRLSPDVPGPVTFGFLHPVILLPARFPGLDAAVRDAILCHEAMHVRRGDWLYTIAEELVRSVFWFHPAIWWLLSEIQLAREQAVDALVVETLHSRETYVDALLAIAGSPPRPDLAPATMFLRKRHLKQRVVSILKEVRMSKRKSFSALAAGVVMLGVSCWFVTGALPLSAEPQTVSDARGVAVQLNGGQYLHRSPVSYPQEAIAKGIEGTVVAQVRMDGAGNVVDASILSGPDELRRTVLQSVLGWHFLQDAAFSTRQVNVIFTLPQAAPQPGGMRVRISEASAASPARQPDAVKTISVRGISDEAKTQLLARLPVHEGDAVKPETQRQIAEAVTAFDEHLTTSVLPVSPTESMVAIAPKLASATDGPETAGRAVMRVGAAVEEANILQKIDPIYPTLAKAARVQGTVKFDITIGKDGYVSNAKLISGPPLLVQAAVQAVRQWVYKPTLLNGEPVDIVTSVDINFTLSQ